VREEHIMNPRHEEENVNPQHFIRIHILIEMDITRYCCKEFVIPI
jgi:hypothetical protein